MEGPSSADVAQVQSSFLGQRTVSCSVCLDAVNDVGERSIAKLKCGHHFHLDCIGSAFNAKGSMQCPNCRCIEEGQWLYANGSRRLQNSSMDGLEEGDLFAGIIDILQSNEDYHRRQVHAGSHLPFGSPPTYQYLTLVFERTNAPPSAYAEYVAHVLYSQQRSLSASAHTCPYLATQRTSFDESVTASYGRAELSSPLQNRRHDGNSARMQTVHLSEGGTRSSGGAGNLHSSRSVAEIDSADSTIFPNDMRRSSRLGSGNHVAANHGGASMQFGQTGVSRRSVPPLSRGTSTPRRTNAIRVCTFLWFPRVRGENSISHQRAYDRERYSNSSHHISDSQSAEGMTSDRRFHQSLQAQVDSWSPFGHHDMNPFLGFPPASMQDGSDELRSPHNNFVGPET